jgi:alcohol dehydrogenase class IV
MQTVRLLQPQRIWFGAGCALQCADDILARALRRVFIVTSPPTAGLTEPLASRLRAGGASVTVYSAIATEPTVAHFEATLVAARAAAPDAIIGLGGGSAMDVAKLVAALIDGRQKVGDVFGIEKLAGRSLFLACLPTTSGTGSEVSPNALLLDESDNQKKGVVSPHLVPDGAYVDPLLTLSVPPAVTAGTGIDALVHCIETYANRVSHPLVDIYGLEGIRLVNGNLLRAVTNGGDVEARTNMAMASLLGGLCLAPVNTAAVHALAYPLGSEFHVAHGVSNAVLLPHVLRFNLPAAPQRYANIARAMGAAADEPDEVAAVRGVERIQQLMQECGIPQGMRRLGVPESAIPRMAEAAMKVQRLLKNNLRELTVADAEAIYRAAY